MHRSIEKLKNIFEDMQLLHRAFYDEVVPITEGVKIGEYCPKDLANLGFLLREGEDLCDDWRKENKARKELIGRVLAKILLELDTDFIRAELCNAKINYRMRPDFPAKGSSDYYELCRHYGIENPDDVPIRLSWDGIGKECTRLTEEGKPLPPGMKNAKADFSCTYTRKERNV